MNDSCEYGSCHLLKFAEFYAPFHQPLALAVCFLGILANSVNVIVLTKKSMRTSTNSLLTGLSVAQLALVTNYCILQFFEMARTACYPEVWSYDGTSFKYVNVNMNIFFHSVAFAHTVSLALFRYVAIKWPLSAQRWLKVSFARKWTLALFVFFVLFCTPQYFCIVVEEIEHHWHNCSKIAGKHVVQYDLVWSDNQSLRDAAFWLFGISFKLLPCFLVTFLSSGLILSIRQRERRKMFLLGKAPVSKTEINGIEDDKISNDHTTAGPNSRHTTHNDSSGKKSKVGVRVRTRTTRMLIATVFLCVSVELPHGIINLMTAIYGERFARNVYDNLGDILEMLTLIYSSVTFILYCTMSSDFRRTFFQLQLVGYCRSILSRCTFHQSFLALFRKKKVNKNKTTDLQSNSCEVSKVESSKSHVLSFKNRVRRLNSGSKKKKKFLTPDITRKMKKEDIEFASESSSSYAHLQQSDRSLLARETLV